MRRNSQARHSDENQKTTQERKGICKFGRERSQGKKETSSETPSQLPADIPAQIKQLAELKDQGILTEEEFETKKAELLKKI